MARTRPALAISVTTAQMIACSSSWSWMLHDSAGKLLDLGRRRRRPNTALRRAARERDTCRCRFPGCESRRVDLHHVQYWSNGGRTKLDNLVSLCKYHHMLVHERGYLIATTRDGTFAFCHPDGTAIPASPPLPQADGTIGDCHDADVPAETNVPAWYGEHPDLDYAIYVCLANAQTKEERQADRDQAGESGTRERVGSSNRRAGRTDAQSIRRACRMTTLTLTLGQARAWLHHLRNEEGAGGTAQAGGPDNIACVVKERRRIRPGPG